MLLLWQRPYILDEYGMNKMRALGLDIGTKNIGLAISDELGMIAHGREVVKRISDAKAIGRISEIVAAERVTEIVVGMPFNMDGSIGERGRDSERFAKKIEEAVGLPVKLWDERLSTKEAEAVLIQADVTRGKRKKVIDKLAAQLILQSYLDSIGSNS